MGTGGFNAGGNPAMDWHPIQGGVEIFLVASCHGNRDKLRPDGPLGLYADFCISLADSFSFLTCMDIFRLFDEKMLSLSICLQFHILHCMNEFQ